MYYKPCQRIPGPNTFITNFVGFEKSFRLVGFIYCLELEQTEQFCNLQNTVIVSNDSLTPTKWLDTKTIRQQTGDKLLECVWPFCVFKRLKNLSLENLFLVRLAPIYIYQINQNKVPLVLHACCPPTIIFRDKLLNL